jgi:hypothetical protein
MLDMYSHIYQYSNEDIKLISVYLKVHVSLVLGVPLKELRDRGVKIICSPLPLRNKMIGQELEEHVDRL